MGAIGIAQSVYLSTTQQALQYGQIMQLGIFAGWALDNGYLIDYAPNMDAISHHATEDNYTSAVFLKTPHGRELRDR